mmetsp:Transcript_7022/g.9501  ORF Transcript_7022/g.9501 Transcript_7022/m.9501 type:complete len:111 (-) Transcript_7022:134-466(-)
MHKLQKLPVSYEKEREKRLKLLLLCPVIFFVNVHMANQNWIKYQQVKPKNVTTMFCGFHSKMKKQWIYICHFLDSCIYVNILHGIQPLALIKRKTKRALERDREIKMWRP